MAKPVDMSGLRQAVDQLSELQRQAASITAGRADNWRHDLVATRRELATATGRLYDRLEGFRLVAKDNEAMPSFLRAFSNVRRALALHQATWPAVSVEPDAPTFRASVTELRSAYGELRACLAEVERVNGRAIQE